MGQLRIHARRRARALLEQAAHERDFTGRIGRDHQPRERRLLAELRFRVHHLRHLARLWQAFAERKT